MKTTWYRPAGELAREIPSSQLAPAEEIVDPTLEHCPLCAGNGYRWVREPPYDSPHKTKQTLCCDCGGKGRRPALANTGV